MHNIIVNNRIFNTRFTSSRKKLLLTAGAIWIIAGCNILAIAISSWIKYSGNIITNALLAIVVFSIFQFIIFRNILNKNIQRITKKESDKNHPLSFFNIRGWILMAFMITLGALLRHFNLLSPDFITIFYTGLSLSLITTGVLFLLAINEIGS